MIFLSLPLRDQSRIHQPAQGGLKSKIFAASNVRLDLPQHDPPGSDLRRTRSKRRQPGCNQIGIDERWATRFIRKKLRRERRLAGSIWTRNDDDLLFMAHTAISPLLINRHRSVAGKSTKSSQTPSPTIRR